MSIIKIVKNLFNKQVKIDAHCEFYNSYSQLSHDLKNNFVAIRASLENIKQRIHISSEVNRDNIDKAFFGLNKKIIHSMTTLNMMNIALNNADNWPNDTSNMSVINCIEHAIQSYPFPSDKYARSINISQESKDFFILGNKYLIDCIFYCLIKNALHSIYTQGDGEVNIELQNSNVHFNFIETAKITAPQHQYNLFTLGAPEKPGSGLNFIKNAMKSMKGNIIFKRQSNNLLTVTLLFSK